MSDNQLAESIREGLSDALLCSRVWEAWSFGTMTQDDFTEAREDDDFVAGIANAILARFVITPKDAA